MVSVIITKNNNGLKGPLSCQDINSYGRGSARRVKTKGPAKQDRPTASYGQHEFWTVSQLEAPISRKERLVPIICTQMYEHMLGP